MANQLISMQRNTVLDVLRAFCIIGLCAGSAAYIFQSDIYFGTNPVHSASLHEQVIYGVFYTFIHGVFYAGVAAIFGISLSLMRDRARSSQFVSRMVVLFFIGIFHSMFIWGGDAFFVLAISGLTALMLSCLIPRVVIGMLAVLFYLVTATMLSMGSDLSLSFISENRPYSDEIVYTWLGWLVKEEASILQLIVDKLWFFDNPFHITWFSLTLVSYGFWPYLSKPNCRFFEYLENHVILFLVLASFLKIVLYVVHIKSGSHSGFLLPLPHNPFFYIISLPSFAAFVFLIKKAVSNGFNFGFISIIGKNTLTFYFLFNLISVLAVQLFILFGILDKSPISHLSAMVIFAAIACITTATVLLWVKWLTYGLMEMAWRQLSNAVEQWLNPLTAKKGINNED